METILNNLLSKANKRLGKAQKSYKLNFNAKLQQKKENIAIGDNVYLCVERRDESEH